MATDYYTTHRQQIQSLTDERDMWKEAYLESMKNTNTFMQIYLIFAIVICMGLIWHFWVI